MLWKYSLTWRQLRGPRLQVRVRLGSAAQAAAMAHDTGHGRVEDGSVVLEVGPPKTTRILCMLGVPAHICAEIDNFSSLKTGIGVWVPEVLREEQTKSRDRIMDLVAGAYRSERAGLRRESRQF